jgi:hypothetical protein
VLLAVGVGALEVEECVVRGAGLDTWPSAAGEDGTTVSGEVGDATTDGTVDAVERVPVADADAVPADDAVVVDTVVLVALGLTVDVGLAADVVLGGFVVRTCTMSSAREHPARPPTTVSTSRPAAPAVRVPRRPIVPASLRTPATVTHRDDSSRIGARGGEPEPLPPPRARGRADPGRAPPPARRPAR